MRLGSYAQDHSQDFASDTNVTDGIAGYARANAADGDDLETLIRGTLGRLLLALIHICCEQAGPDHQRRRSTVNHW